MKNIKFIIKRFLLLLGVLVSLPLIILTYFESFLFGKDTERIYSSCKEILACIPTIIGNYTRLGFYWAVCSNVSPDVSLLLGSMIAHRDTTIGSNIVIGCYTIIGYAEIGDDVIFGSRCSVISGKYQHGRPEDRLKDTDVVEEYSKIIIGTKSWIGEGALILANVGPNCTVGAGSMVFKEVPEGITVMGNPARKVSMG